MKTNHVKVSVAAEDATNRIRIFHLASDGVMQYTTDRPQREFCWMGNKHSNPGDSRNWYRPGLPRSVPRPGDRIRIMLGSEIPDSLARLLDMETA